MIERRLGMIAELAAWADEAKFLQADLMRFLSAGQH
jgi:hypothetical protein